MPTWCREQGFINTIGRPITRGRRQLLLLLLRCVAPLHSAWYAVQVASVKTFSGVPFGRFYAVELICPLVVTTTLLPRCCFLFLPSFLPCYLSCMVLTEELVGGHGGLPVVHRLPVSKKKLPSRFCCFVFFLSLFCLFFKKSTVPVTLRGHVSSPGVVSGTTVRLDR